MPPQTKATPGFLCGLSNHIVMVRCPSSSLSLHRCCASPNDTSPHFFWHRVFDRVLSRRFRTICFATEPNRPFPPDFVLNLLIPRLASQAKTPSPPSPLLTGPPQSALFCRFDPPFRLSCSPFRISLRVTPGGFRNDLVDHSNTPTPT